MGHSQTGQQAVQSLDAIPRTGRHQCSVVTRDPRWSCWLLSSCVDSPSWWSLSNFLSVSLVELLSANHLTLNLFPTSWLMVLIASASLWFHCLGIYVLPSIWGTQICFPYQLPVSFSLLPVLSDQRLSNLDMESPERFTKTQMAPHRLRSFWFYNIALVGSNNLHF